MTYIRHEKISPLIFLVRFSFDFLVEYFLFLIPSDLDHLNILNVFIYKVYICEVYYMFGLYILHILFTTFTCMVIYN